MIKEKVESELNKQINAEMYSSYLYLSMAAYFESIYLKGFANWMRAQAKEEEGHAMKFFDYLNERGGRVKLSQVDAPKFEWKSPLEAFSEVYSHEQKVTGLIHALVNLAVSEKDHATSNFLQWFVKEQVEEEANAEEILAKLKMIKDSTGSLLIIDKQLGKRESEEEKD